MLLVALFTTFALVKSVEIGYCQLTATVNDPTITGYIEFWLERNNVIMHVEASGITIGADSLHGVHAHMYGDLTSADGSSAGDHWNPDGAPHGCPGNITRHNGDTGNWQVRRGKISQTKILDLLTLSGTNSLIGHAVVLHAAQDNCVTVPSSGVRLAYCVIGIANPTYYRSQENTAVASPVPPFGDKTAGICVLRSTRGSAVNGIIYIENIPQSGTRVRAIVNGLSSGKYYGFHIHQWGDIRDTNGRSIGGHWNPTNRRHGVPPSLERHIGDLGNIYRFQNNGIAYYEYNFGTNYFGLNGSPFNVIGHSIAIDSSPDSCNQGSERRANPLAQCVIGYANPNSLNYVFPSLPSSPSNCPL